MHWTCECLQVSSEGNLGEQRVIKEVSTYPGGQCSEMIPKIIVIRYLCQEC